MTRFDEISPLWRIFKVFGIKLRGYRVLGKIVSYFGNLFTPMGGIFHHWNGQILNKTFVHLVTLMRATNFAASFTKIFSSIKFANFV